MAILFIHGFGASPSEVYPVAAAIHEAEGYTVKGPLLPGHGTLPEDLNNTNWMDWYETVKREVGNLQQGYDKVILVGLSMGGLLALHAGCRLKGICAVVAINAPIFNKQPLITLMAPVIQYIKPYYPKKMDETRARLEEQGRFAYKVTPVRAFRSMMRLRRIVMGELDRLDAPLLVIQSLQDQSVKVESADYIINHAINSKATLLKLSHSGHIATMGPEKDKIVQAIIEIADHTKT
jgi:carboxylesterase